MKRLHVFLAYLFLTCCVYISFYEGMILNTSYDSTANTLLDFFYIYSIAQGIAAAFYLVYTGNSKGSAALGTVSTDDDGNESTTANATSGITSTNVLAYYYSGKYCEYPYGNSKETEDYPYTMNDVKDANLFVSQIYDELKDLLA